MNGVSLGYGIAIMLGILVLISTIMLALYMCIKIHGRSRHQAVGYGGGSYREENSPTGAARFDDTGIAEWSVGGLDQATLESYPKVVYSEKQPLPPAHDTPCSICLAEYKDREILRLLPDCRHVFHAACIDEWLRLHASCPMCRSSPLPTPQRTPISTPLSEHIPLARNALNNHLDSPLRTPQRSPISTPLSELIPLARNPLNVQYTIHRDS